MEVTTQTMYPDKLSTVLSIIERKLAHKKEWDAIKRLEAFYENDIKDISKKLHKVNWSFIVIDTMTDDHLFNTIKQQLVQNRWDFKAINSKYINEAKNRPQVMERVLAIEDNEIVPVSYEARYSWDEFEFEI